MTNKIGIYRDLRNKRRPWVCRWFGDYDPETGKQKRYIKSFARKAEAEELAAEQNAAFMKGERRDKPEEITLGEFCKDWFKTKKPQFRPGTVLFYENTIYRLLDCFSPEILISRITPIEAAKFVAGLKYMARDMVLSNASRHRVLRNCRTMFNDAVTWQLIKTNPFKTVKAPKCSVKRWHYLLATEFSKLLDASPSLRWKALNALAYTAGLRLGEALNLTWADVDLDKALVVVQNREGTTALPPFCVKDNEKRTISLPSQTVKILQDLRQSNPAVFKVPYVLLTNRQYKGVIAKYESYRKQKRPWLNRNMGNNMLTNFKRHVKKAGIKPNGQLAIHTLRKSCIQTWADHLWPNVTKELAGHSDLATTLKYYNQVDDYHRAKAAEIMEKWLNKKIG
ncbi:MAG: site-specific integrase [Phycisphaerales bacterium]|nr:MAG: site-specific integrase [Phycisphaerales bacterium]